MNNIKKYRAKVNLTQAELAKKIGISRTALANLENGIISGNQRSCMLKLSGFFGVSIVQLLGMDNFKYAPLSVNELKWTIKMLQEEINLWESEEK